jgi:trk system potassium uptake protein TrkA
MKQFVIIGMGRFGASVAKTLCSTGNDVLGVDIDEEKVQNISDHITHAAQADATDDSALKALGIRNFDVAVITIGQDIQASILITLLCKEAGVKYVLAKAQSELHAKVLYKIGADKVVLPERDMGMRVAHNLVSSSILDYIELAPEYTLVEVLALDSWEGKTLREINIRANFGVNVIAIKHQGNINVAPSADDYINQGDVIVIIGSKEDINTLSFRE